MMTPGDEKIKSFGAKFSPRSMGESKTCRVYALNQVFLPIYLYFCQAHHRTHQNKPAPSGLSSPPYRVALIWADTNSSRIQSLNPSVPFPNGKKNSLAKAVGHKPQTCQNYVLFKICFFPPPKPMIDRIAGSSTGLYFG